jgi:hypothetical protein
VRVAILSLIITLGLVTGRGQDYFKADYVDLGTNAVLQFEPHPTNTAYYLLTSTNRWIVSGTQIITAYAGQCAKLSWKSYSNRACVLSWSTNSVQWNEIRVKIFGNGSTQSWYVNLPPTNVTVNYHIQAIGPSAPTSLHLQ